MRIDHRVSPLSPSPLPVELRDLWHRFEGAGQSWTLKGIDLKLAAGELVGLLGPSGCGKTTLLRLIAGFETPSRGSVHLQQGLVAGDGRWVPPERRGVGMVFQDYALFPHLTAWQNACFGQLGAPPCKGQLVVQALLFAAQQFCDISKLGVVLTARDHLVRYEGCSEEDDETRHGDELGVRHEHRLARVGP